MRWTPKLLLRLAVFYRVQTFIEEWCTPGPWIKRIGKRIPVPIKERWSRLPELWRHIVTNVCIGVGIAVILPFFHATPWLHEAEIKAMDSVNAWLAGTQFGLGSSPGKEEYLFAFIDIDEQTYREWGEPLFTPRDKLLALLRYAVESEAKLIIVDIDLTRSNTDNQEADKALREYLVSLQSTKDSYVPPIIFVKTMRTALIANDDKTSSISNYKELRHSFLDDIVDNSSGFYWASPLYSQDEDRVVRRWRILECVKTESGIDTLPSVQLLSYSILKPYQQNGNAEQQTFPKVLSDITSQCSLPEKSALNNKEDKFIFGNIEFSLNSHGLENRIIFSMPFNKEQPNKTQPKVTIAGKRLPVLIYIQGRTIFSGGAARIQNEIKNRIVVIGGSYEDGHDTHLTPLGDMPGSMIVLNAVRSLISYGTKHELSWYWKLCLEIGLIIIMTMAFLRFNSFFGMLLSGAIIIIVLVPLSVCNFRNGMWIDFAIPLIAVQVHQMVEEFKEKHISHE